MINPNDVIAWTLKSTNPAKESSMSVERHLLDASLLMRKETCFSLAQV